MRRPVGALPVLPPQPVGACRICHTDSYIGDDTGPVHRCCAKTEAAGETTCVACRESRAAIARHMRWTR